MMHFALQTTIGIRLTCVGKAVGVSVGQVVGVPEGAWRYERQHTRLIHIGFWLASPQLTTVGDAVGRRLGEGVGCAEGAREGGCRKEKTTSESRYSKAG
jgi:hypothetical protein